MCRSQNKTIKQINREAIKIYNGPFTLLLFYLNIIVLYFYSRPIKQLRRDSSILQYNWFYIKESLSRMSGAVRACGDCQTVSDSCMNSLRFIRQHFILWNQIKTTKPLLAVFYL